MGPNTGPRPASSMPMTQGMAALTLQCLKRSRVPRTQLSRIPSCSIINFKLRVTDRLWSSDTSQRIRCSFLLLHDLVRTGMQNPDAASQSAASLWRAKVYRLNPEGAWIDRGTGMICCEWLEASCRGGRRRRQRDFVTKPRMVCVGRALSRMGSSSSAKTTTRSRCLYIKSAKRTSISDQEVPSISVNS